MNDNRFNRLEILFGQKGVNRLANASIAVFGLGGVGSFAVEALIRSGVGRLTLIDFDTIDITNINRQLHATDDTVGRPKVQVMSERCLNINPNAKIEPILDFFTVDNSSELLDRGYDYVLDCIDHVTAKLTLIEESRKKNIPIIASMGAANKTDPTQIRVADLAETHGCRLARIVRRELRKRGIETGLKVVYSTEGFVPLASGRRETDEDGHYQERRAPLGSSSVIPPIFGLTMAGEVIRDLTKGED
jgi:tRNA A37 threonylcarbamoyladenosine dehydratase